MEKRRINVRAVVVRGDTILAVKHKNDDGSETDYWALPGGGLDPLETLHEGAKREVFEELGVHADVTDKVLFIQQFMSGRKEFDEELEFHILVKDSPLFDSIDLTQTSHGASELVRVAFVDPKKVPVKPDFLAEVDIRAYATGDRAPYLFTELVK